MNQNNSVIFKGKNGGILIILDDKITFAELKDLFKKKVESAGVFFQGANTAITFQGRELSDSEEMELLDIISEISGLNISFVHGKGEDPIFVKQEKLSKIDDVENIKVTKSVVENVMPQNVFSVLENMTSFHKGSIRSGQSLKFKGSIVIIGDINPGGEVIAEGNIIVLGSIKGLVHAGCSGEADCFIIGLNLKPTQLRIADIVTYFPKKDKTPKISPECVFAKNGEIYVEPLANF